MSMEVRFQSVVELIYGHSEAVEKRIDVISEYWI